MSVRKPQPSLLAFTPPCLAQSARVPPDGSDWIHEIKFDGYRVQALVENGTLRLLTRNALDWTPRFGKVAQDFAALPVKSVAIDCEAVVLDQRGISRFASLQSELKKGAAARVQMMAFDLLHLNGCSMAERPLLERKEILAGLFAGPLPQDLLRYSQHMIGDGVEILRKACAMDLEGIVSKRIDQPYRSGRNGDWTKAKCVMADPFVVIGYVPSKTASGIVGSLVMGFYEESTLVYAGRVGTGFTQAEARAMADTFARIHVKPALLAKSLTRQQKAGVRWIEPTLVAQITYRDVTEDQILRQAAFEHFREDKRPEEIGRPATFVIGSHGRKAQ